MSAICPGPATRRGTVDAERRDPDTALDQRRTNERRRVGREQRFALPVQQPRISSHVIDDDRLTPTARIDDGVAETGERASAGERRDAVNIRLADDRLVAIDMGVTADTARLQMCANQGNRGILDRARDPARNAAAR